MDIIVKNGVAVYVGGVLHQNGTHINGRFDPTTRLDNAHVVEVDVLPDNFCQGCFTWDGERLSPTPDYVERTKRASILAQIVALESRQTPRMLREAALDINGGKELLAEINTQIGALRAQLPAA